MESHLLPTTASLESARIFNLFYAKISNVALDSLRRNAKDEKLLRLKQTITTHTSVESLTAQFNRYNGRPHCRKANCPNMQ